MQIWLLSDGTTYFHGILTLKQNTTYEKMVLAAGHFDRSLRIPIQ